MTRAEIILGMAEDLDAEHKIRQAKEYSDYRTKKTHSQRDITRAHYKGAGALAGGALGAMAVSKGGKALAKAVHDRGGAKQVAHSAGIALKRKVMGD